MDKSIVNTRAQILECFEKIKLMYNIQYDLKSEQLDIITSLSNNQDVFAVLPTGFGKSACYTFFPLIVSQISGKQSTALVISPLNALMDQQVTKLKGMGIKAAALTPSESGAADLSAIMSGKVDVLFASPEVILKEKWMKVIRTVYKHQLVLQAYDEVHCVSEWGEDFRPDYKRISQLCAIVDAPTLCLTATATLIIQKDVYGVLCLDDVKTEIISKLPDRPNVFIQFSTVRDDATEELRWLSDKLVSLGLNMPKTVVFYESMQRCQSDFNTILERLGTTAYHETDKIPNRMLEMFHSATEHSTKERILAEFSSTCSKIRVLFATVAFGMGIDIPDIELVVNWGLPKSLLQFWQESGRCARDGRPGEALCLVYKRSVTLCQDPILKQMSKVEFCLRRHMLKTFILKGMDPKSLDKLGLDTYVCKNSCQGPCTCRLCSCCSYCFQQCKCENKEMTSQITGLGR